jgi:hypothetical protein
MLSVVSKPFMLRVIMLSHYAESYYYAECRYAKCCGTQNYQKKG